MPRLRPLDPSRFLTPAMQDKMLEFMEREAKELADIGIGILADTLKRRLSRARLATTAGQQNGKGPPVSRAVGAYQLLGVAPDAPMKQVEHVFRKRVMACHPDRGGDEEELRQVLMAIRQIREERKV